MPKFYPIMLDVRGRPAIVIGGDRIAAEKAMALSASGARVTVMSAEFCTELEDLAQRALVTLLPKAYEPGDLAGAFVVVASTKDPELIDAIWHETQERGQLVNIVDVPSRCSYIVPSIMRRGQLTIAVSTEGSSPGLAKRIRQRLEGLFPPAYDIYMQLATLVRAHLRQSGLSYEERDDFFGDFFHSDILNLLAEGDEAAALNTTVELLRRYNIERSAETLSTELREAVAHGNSNKI